jgi:hypothetical protein
VIIANSCWVDKKAARPYNLSTQSSPPPPPHSQVVNSAPLSRNNSNVSSTTALTRENSTHSRGGSSGIARLDDSFTSESRRIGRFELTSNESSRQQSIVENAKDESSPYSTHSSSYTSSSQSFTRQPNNKSMPVIYNQLDELLKQNDSQRQMLTELFNLFETPKSYSSANTETTRPQQELVSTIVSIP